MNDYLKGRYQLEDALADRLRRVEGVAFKGLCLGTLFMFQDDGPGGTGTSFCVEPGETIGAALERVDQRYREAGSK